MQVALNFLSQLAIFGTSWMDGANIGKIRGARAIPAWTAERYATKRLIYRWFVD